MNPRTVFPLLTIGLALCLCSSGGAQIGPPPPPLKLPDLVISSLSAKLIAPNRVQYSWTVTNVGNAPANLDGPTANNADNVSVQAFVSKDTVFGNTGDIPAGGTILGTSPLGQLAPQASKSGTFTATVQANFTKLTQLVLKVDSGKVVTEFNEDNNTAAVGIAR
ncbi:MAG: CARDB domain-containing protein [Chthoniobacterales bacterium]